MNRKEKWYNLFRIIFFVYISIISDI